MICSLIALLLLTSCGGPTGTENCTELRRFVDAEYGQGTGRDEIGEEQALEIARHADELAGRALAAGADREWTLCYEVAARVLSNVVSVEFENICESLHPDDC